MIFLDSKLFPQDIDDAADNDNIPSIPNEPGVPKVPQPAPEASLMSKLFTIFAAGQKEVGWEIIKMILGEKFEDFKFSRIFNFQ